MVAQIYKPIFSAPNDNLISNSGLWENSDGFDVTKGIRDTSKDFNGCYGFKCDETGNLQIHFKSGILYKEIGITSFFVLTMDNTNIMVSGSGNTECYNSDSFFHAVNELFMYDNVNISNNIPFKIETRPSYQVTPTQESVKKVYQMYHDIYINVSGSPNTWVYFFKTERGTQSTLYCPSIYDNVEWNYDQYNASFQSAKVGDIKNISYYNYKKSRTEVGLFSMSIPKGTTFADEIDEDYYIVVDHKDWLIVQDVNTINGDYKITGTDLKGLLMLRIATNDVVNNAMEYDKIQGSTEECLKHYIINNMINPTDRDRIIPLVTMAENKGRGIANDSFKARFEYLNDIARVLCENANIGYDLNPDIMNNKIVFDIVDTIDKTINQDIRNRVIFDIRRKNVLSIERCKGNSTYKNAFYSTKSGGSLESDATTILCLRDGEITPKGIARKETHINVSCEDISEISTYAKQEMTENKKIDSLNVDPADAENFGSVYDIGDKVTIKSGNEYVDKVIKEAEKTYDGINLNIKLGFGDGKPQPLAYLKTMIKNKGV